jgi:1-acyl-sn-glycerol-3-phosphate acyltransferase
MADSTFNSGFSGRPGWSLTERDPRVIRSFMPLWEWFYRHYFRVQVEGRHHVPPGQALFIGSHNGGLAAPDMIMLTYDWYQHFGLDRPIYGLMHPQVWRGLPPLARLAEQVGAIAAHPRVAEKAIETGASLMIYPGGPQEVFRPHSQRNEVRLQGRTGFIKLALKHDLPIVPIVSTGSHETLFVLTDIYPQMRRLHDEWGMPWIFGVDPLVFPIYFGLPWGLTFGPVPHWPLPLPIRISMSEPIKFDRSGPDACRDRSYVQACYDRVVAQMQQDLDRITIG